MAAVTDYLLTILLLLNLVTNIITLRPLQEGPCKKCISILSAGKNTFPFNTRHLFSLRKKQIMKFINFPFSPWLPGRKEPNLHLNFNNFVKLCGLYTGITTFSCSLLFPPHFYFYPVVCFSLCILSCFKYFALTVSPVCKVLPLYLQQGWFLFITQISAHCHLLREAFPDHCI